ncbi:RNA polymerase sigma-70 factor [Mucilaginibacter sp. OK098]|uniref:RNA polymerase sigma-70 factor n=1 Tax=Mucilaginibacter sp. OK098 TaxID=1855297 RepID=UPI00091F94B4|nr:RNA polymerase sigma-70 factor [Mucilaginibacter sp. OK098]SHN36420.1 RNA polymerase sigma-70 factor, ECF subfamily [Mucilaginibacter sp. OK098]
MEQSEPELIKLVIQGSEMAFERFFKTYYESLQAYAYVMLQDEVVAEEMVQQVFYKLWEKKSLLNIHTSIKAFLYRSVYNECLNYLKHQKHKLAYENHSQYAAAQTYQERTDDLLALSELQNRLQKAINELPEQCRNIFYMNRMEELKYREIADQLGLSIKTVEAQISKALKILRKKLVDFIPVIIGLLLNTKWFK